MSERICTLRLQTMPFTANWNNFETMSIEAVDQCILDLWTKIPPFKQYFITYQASRRMIKMRKVIGPHSGVSIMLRIIYVGTRCRMFSSDPTTMPPIETPRLPPTPNTSADDADDEME